MLNKNRPNQSTFKNCFFSSPWVLCPKYKWIIFYIFDSMLKVLPLTLWWQIHFCFRVTSRLRYEEPNFRQKEKEILDRVLGSERYDRRIRPAGMQNDTSNFSFYTRLNKTGLRPVSRLLYELVCKPGFLFYGCIKGSSYHQKVKMAMKLYLLNFKW